MAVDAIKKVSTDNGWTFSYGAGQWLNLVDYKSDFRKKFEDRAIHTLLYTVSKNEQYSSYGAIESESYSCIFMIGVTANIADKDYNYKWENNIQPLIESKVNIFKEAINGCGYIITGGLSEKEFSNLFDNNLDGVTLEFTLTKG